MHDPVDDLKVRVFHGIGHHHDHRDIARYIHHVTWKSAAATRISAGGERWSRGSFPSHKGH
jgi:hypothetical protein